MDISTKAATTRYKRKGIMGLEKIVEITWPTRVHATITLRGRERDRERPRRKKRFARKYLSNKGIREIKGPNEIGKKSHGSLRERIRERESERKRKRREIDR